MDERDFIREIAQAWELLKSPLDVGRFFITPGSLQIDADFQRISLNEDATYEEIFRVGLNRSNYNILLSDYAYFQFGWSAQDTWRLGYYPNPWLSGAPAHERQLKQWEMLEEIGAITNEAASNLIAELPYVGAIPPIRYEFAASQYREFAHPAAHFHIGRHTENRWPSAISLGPKAFALIIAKMYYRDAWRKCSAFHGAAAELCIESVLSSTMDDSRMVHDFSERERRSFHFGKNMRAN